MEESKQQTALFVFDCHISKFAGSMLENLYDSAFSSVCVKMVSTISGKLFPRSLKEAVARIQLTSFTTLCAITHHQRIVYINIAVITDPR